ncbi:MAG: GTPase domain-containing protein, partial [Desulfobacterales bacterium]|nr:GTPase domain-containing protein [Desulfobacterales bacterium]
KSTIFNAFCGKRLSETGVERPKTSGPIVYAHQECPITNGFPFPSVQVEHQAFEDSRCRPTTGTPGCLLVLQHNRQDCSHIVVVDTPDLDSVEAENRQIAEDFYLLSDAVVFVTSQEKYADDVPYQFLLRVIQGEKPLFFLINKVNERLTREEVLGALESQGGQTGSLDTARMWFIPYAPSRPFQWISQDAAFSDFLHSFSQEFPIEKIKDFRAAQQTTRAGDLKIRFRRLLDLLEEENGEAQRWLTHLTALYEKISQDLVKEEERRFTTESRQHLQTEIRRLFTKYDVLAKPRRFIRELILTPFRLLGLRKESSHDAHKDALQRVRQKIDMTPVQGAIERFNRLVLEELSPSDEHSPLFRKLRQ